MNLEYTLIELGFKPINPNDLLVYYKRDDLNVAVTYSYTETENDHPSYYMFLDKYANNLNEHLERCAPNWLCEFTTKTELEKNIQEYLKN